MAEPDAPWRVLRRKAVYESPWVNLYQDTVQLPDGSVVEDYHVVDYPRPAAGVIPIGEDARILMVDHYRFISRTRGWEIPAGRVEFGEDPAATAARELEEEAGYSAGEIVRLGSYIPTIGSGTMRFHLFIARALEPSNGPLDTNEVMGKRWFTAAEVRALIADNAIVDGLSLTALLWAREKGII